MEGLTHVHLDYIVAGPTIGNPFPYSIYRIEGNFRGRKLSPTGYCAKWTTPIFVEKSFMDDLRSAKFFSLESFPLYGSVVINSTI